MRTIFVSPMKTTVEKHRKLLEGATLWFQSCPDDAWFKKPAPNKWSKQEILGHLIDSAINNLKRFTDCQFSDGPYKVVEYKQDNSVEVGQYQQADRDKTLVLWLALNDRVETVIRQQTEKSLSLVVVLSNATATDLRWLMSDYVDHFEHHLKQIMQ